MSPDGGTAPRPPAPPRRTRELQFDRVMSASEAIMWKVDGDPWLRPVAGSLAVVDQPIDFEAFERRMRRAVAAIPRLRERVAVPSGLSLAPPTWEPDADFDLSHHLRHVAMPADASVADLQELVSHWYEDPLDPTRPPWEFVVIDGVDGGGALFWKIHHTISDGEGLVRLSERYMEAERHAPVPKDVDLDAIVAEAAAAAPRPAAAPSPAGRLVQAARLGVKAGWLPMVAGRRLAGAATLAALDPGRLVEAADGIVGAARGLAGQIGGASLEAGSTLWTGRSARRHLESVRIPLDAARRVGRALGGSVNDVFVTGAVNGVLDYHAKHDAPVPHLNFSFVVSQRKGGGVGGNFFTPLRVQVPGDPASPAERFVLVRDRMAARRAAAEGGDPVANLARLARVLPAPMLRRAGRSQVSGVDFATSNMRGASFPLYISGARVLYTLTLGPVAGTAFNLTTVSYDGSLDMGLLVDSAAVEDPAGLRSSLEEAYADLLVSRPPT